MKTRTLRPWFYDVAARCTTGLIRLSGALGLYFLFGLLASFAFASGGTTDPMASTHGSLWLLTNDGGHNEALLVETKVAIDVSGMIARASIKQHFRNNSDLWAEGIYVFPLPDNAAVDRFRLRIGDRIIEGQIEARDAARKSYQTAKIQGKQAGLVEQQRPNVFTTSIANIAPEDTLEVEIEYQQTVTYRDGRFHLRFPLVTGPRFRASAPGADNADAATDVSTIVSEEPVNAVFIHITLDAGVPLASLDSGYHEIDVRQTDSDRYSIALASDGVMADRDFELTWTPEFVDRPRTAVFRQQLDGYEYALLSILPPDLRSLGQQILPRDVIFVIDVSGSMSGASIEQARTSVLHALARMKPQDRFNVIWFNDRTERLYPKSVSATRGNIQFASNFIGSLRADGGTVMMPALALALNDQPDIDRLRQIVFITDGNVDNEKELFALIKRQLGENRLFTVGIGSAPNSYFMHKAARSGRGTYTFIGKLDEVEQKTRALFEQMESPSLVNIDVRLEGGEIEVFPQPIPDLYLGEPLTVLIRGRSLGDKVVVYGDYGDSLWQQETVLDRTGSHTGISTAWARAKIRSLMEQHHDAESGVVRESLKRNVIRLAMNHNLVSQFTSMVAVDATPVNSTGELYSEKLKTSLPHGWRPQQSRQPIGQQILLAQLNLPQTATSASLHAMIAAMLFALAMVFYLWRKSL